MLSLCIAYNNALFLRKKNSYKYIVQKVLFDSWSLFGLCTSEISTALIKKLHDLDEKCVICRGCG